MKLKEFFWHMINVTCIFGLIFLAIIKVDRDGPGSAVGLLFIAFILTMFGMFSVVKNARKRSKFDEIRRENNEF